MTTVYWDLADAPKAASRYCKRCTGALLTELNHAFGGGAQIRLGRSDRSPTYLADLADRLANEVERLREYAEYGDDL